MEPRFNQLQNCCFWTGSQSQRNPWVISTGFTLNSLEKSQISNISSNTWKPDSFWQPQHDYWGHDREVLGYFWSQGLQFWEVWVKDICSKFVTIQHPTDYWHSSTTVRSTTNQAYQLHEHLKDIHEKFPCCKERGLRDPLNTIRDSSTFH